MSTTIVQKSDLMRKIARLPEAKRAEVDRMLDELLEESEAPSPKPISLKGVWKGTDWEKIVDLEGEVRQIRREMGEKILRRFE